MAFIKSGTRVLSFSEYSDVEALDQRLFEANEGLTVDVVEDLLIRSTERILTQLRSTDWWASYYLNQSGASISTRADIPALDASKIIDRVNDFTDLSVFHSLYYYILPRVADFGDQDSAERQKVGHYQQKFNELFSELIVSGDWYDFDGDLTVESSEKKPGYYNLRRVR
jgi:hypothetical protein